MGTKFFNNREGNTLLREFARVFKELDVKDLDILVAYFRASGYKDLQPHLSGIENIRTIVGMGLDEKIKKHHNTVLSSPNSDDEMRSQVLDSIRRDIEEAAYDSKVEKGIKRFFDDVASEKLRLRIHPQRNLHAKFYIYRPAKFDKNNKGEVIMGSSNLTSTGLGSGQEGGNYELNVRLKEYSDVKFATDEFERLWEESRELSANDIKEVQDRSFVGDISPYHLYIKFLMEYFGPDFDVDKSGDWPQKYNKLAFQADAVNEAIQKLDKHDGLFLADVVGLGKTVVASAIAQSYWNRSSGNFGILVVSPRALREHWEEVLNDFLPHAHVKCETPGRLHHISEKAYIYDLVIIDESHRFRNKGKQYECLQDICQTRTIKNRKKKILLISATPLNNRPDDLYNQISLFMDGEDSSLTGRPLAQYFLEVRREYEKIKKLPKAKARRLIKALFSKVRSQVIENIMIRRTRTDLIENKRYVADLKLQNIAFPSAKLKQIYYGLPKKLNSLYDETIDIISGKEQGLSYIRYQILNYVDRQAIMRDSVPAGAAQLAQIMKSLLLKRMDSSFVAFKATLAKFISSSQTMLKMIADDRIFIVKGVRIEDYILDGREDELFELLDTSDTKKGQIVTSEDLDPDFLPGVERDYKILLALEEKWKRVLGDDDPKFDKFVGELDKWLELKSNREHKLVVFTEYKDTMKHLSQRLEGMPYRILPVDSSNAKSELKNIKSNFDASVSEEDQEDQYQILITTDILAEGVNLHRANLVVNYDTPWNVVKLMQRVGRVNRIGTKAPEIVAYNFLPTERVNDDLRLEERALIKAQAFHSALGADSHIYSDEEEAISFRIFQENLAEESNKEIPFREELREFKRGNEEEYNLIKAKSLKQRNAVLDNRRKKRTLIFARTADRRTSSFYLVGPNSGDIKLFDFVECADLLRGGKDKDAVPLPRQHHKQVRAALDKFHREQQGLHGASHNKPVWSRQDVRTASILKSLINSQEASSEHKDFFQKAIEVLKRGNREKFIRELRERASEFRGEKLRLEQIAEFAAFIRLSMPDETPWELIDKLDLSPTVVIAQSYIE